jgi:uncharacterized protein (UPF0332 family)
VTNENRRANIAIEVTRGDASFESAEILLAASKLADATSRAYYGAFHYARALLLMLGEEPLSHAGLERLLHRDIVRPGLLDADIARQFGRLQKMRHDADYTSEIVITLQGATEDVAAARQFIAAARRVLEEGGWLTGES